MLVWAVYDIHEDKIRNRIVKICKRAGLYRVQKSVFIGEIHPSRLDELVEESRAEIDTETDSVYIFPMCEADFKRVKTLGQAFDRKLVTDEVKVLFA